MNIEKLRISCAKNGFELIEAKDKNEALDRAKSFIKNGASVGLGGSVSVEQIGLLEYLVGNKNITLFNQYEEGISKDENVRRRKAGMTADIYITSTNAITLNGELVNCDGEGNRVAAQVFGSEKLLLIVGKNKIVNTIEGAFERIKNVAAVKNAERLNKKAQSFGKEPSFTAEGIMSKFNIIAQDAPKRTTIILVDEELGY